MNVKGIIDLMPENLRQYAVGFINYDEMEPVKKAPTSAEYLYAAKWHSLGDESIAHWHDMRRADRVNIVTWRGPTVKTSIYGNIGWCILLAIPTKMGLNLKTKK